MVAETAFTAAIVIARPHRFAWPRLASLRNALTFSTDVVVARLSWYGYSNADFVVAGRSLGQQAQGAYAFAWTLASVPVEKITSIIMSVTPAFFSAVQDQMSELNRYLITLTSGIAILSFPLCFGMALVAGDFVPIALGPEGQAAVVPLQVLAVYASARSIGPLLTPVLNAIGETRFAMWNNLLALALMPTAFVIGSRWGIGGVAMGWLAVHPLIMLILFRRVASRTGLSIRSYLLGLAPAITGVAGMVGVVLLLRSALSTSPPALRLGLMVGAGAITYPAILLIGFRGHLRALRDFLSSARRSGASVPGSN
jgi:O-antigen/teichoic acid export membrane protein